MRRRKSDSLDQCDVPRRPLNQAPDRYSRATSWESHSSKNQGKSLSETAISPPQVHCMTTVRSWPSDRIAFTQPVVSVGLPSKEPLHLTTVPISGTLRDPEQLISFAPIWEGSPVGATGWPCQRIPTLRCAVLVQRAAAPVTCDSPASSNKPLTCGRFMEWTSAGERPGALMIAAV